MNNPAYWPPDGAAHRTALDRGALEYLVDRNGLQARDTADRLLAAAASQDRGLSAERARIACARARLEQQSDSVAIFGVVAVVLLVAGLSLVLDMPVADQQLRVLGAGVVVVLFGLLTRQARGQINLVLPLHVAVCVALLSEGGWHASHSAAGWDLALLLLGASAGLASALRDARARAHDIDEADLVLKARGRPASIESTRRWNDAAI